MIVQIVIYFVIGLVVGAVCGYLGHKIVLRNRIAYGTCTKMPDGEMYLRITEEGQRKLVDPSTEMLCIHVTHPDWKEIHPRNVQAL